MTDPAAVNRSRPLSGPLSRLAAQFPEEFDGYARRKVVRILEQLEECIDPEAARLHETSPHELLGEFADALSNLIQSGQKPMWGADYIAPRHVLGELIAMDPQGPRLRTSAELKGHASQ